jgi:hypothetical protein
VKFGFAKQSAQPHLKSHNFSSEWNYNLSKNLTFKWNLIIIMDIDLNEGSGNFRWEVYVEEDVSLSLGCVTQRCRWKYFIRYRSQWRFVILIGSGKLVDVSRDMNLVIGSWITNCWWQR